MFTGIIEETGRIADIRRHSLSASLTVSCRKIMEDIHLGDSIAVNGICLTVTAFSG
ncbi:MAG: riboflavin synthase, partial [Clostridia bacterium]